MWTYKGGVSHSGTEANPKGNWARITYKAASYCTFDFFGGTRLHVWGCGDDAKYAVGHGPIEYITREQALRLVRDAGY